MKRIPPEIKVAAYLLLTVAFLTAAQAIRSVTSLNLSDPLSFIFYATRTHIDPHLVSVIGVTLLQALLIRLVSTIAVFNAPVFFLFLILHNLKDLRGSPGHWHTLSVCIISTAALAHSALLIPRSRRLFSDSNLRWWRTVPRKSVRLGAVVRPVLGGELITQTINLSETGAFVSLQHGKWRDSVASAKRNFKIGTYCAVRLNFDQLFSLSCSAEIVRYSKAGPDTPEGYGIRFVGINPSERRKISTFLGLDPEAQSRQETESLAA